MLVMFVGADRTETAVNAAHVTFVSSVTDGTRIRFGEGRSVTVIEPIAEVMERMSPARRADLVRALAAFDDAATDDPAGTSNGLRTA